MENILATSNIIVVDDRAENLRLIEALLQDKVDSLRMFVSGREAIDSAQHFAPDLFLFDIDMPEMDGYTLCEHFKKDTLLKAIPVIFLSCFSSTFDKVKAFKVGGVDFLTKPFNAEELEARITTHIEHYKFELALQQKNIILSKALAENLAMREQVTLHEKSQAVTELIMGLAREINTPLGVAVTGTSIIGEHIETIKSKQNNKTLTSQLLQNLLVKSLEVEITVSDNLSKACGLIEELSRLCEQITPVYSPVNIPLLVSQVFDAQQRKHQNIKINLFATIDPLVVCSSKSILTEIIQELMANSLSHGDESSDYNMYITAELNEENNEFTLSYWDNGTAPDSSLTGKLLEPFYTTKRGVGMKGLGLYLVNKLTNRLSGSCLVNINKNGSLAFDFCFPINKK